MLRFLSLLKIDFQGALQDAEDMPIVLVKQQAAIAVEKPATRFRISNADTRIPTNHRGKDAQSLLGLMCTWR